MRLSWLTRLARLVPSSWINRVCLHAYTLALLLAFLVFSLLPVHHHLGTRHLNLVAVHEDGRFETEAGNPAELAVGADVPLFRFNPTWQREIGRAVLVENEGDTWTFQADVQGLSFPIGRQTHVTSVDGDRVVLAQGARVTLGRGQVMNIFHGRKRVGTVRITESAPGRTVAKRIDTLPAPQAWVGLQASEFTIPNQVAYTGAAWLPAFDYLALFLTLGVWVWNILTGAPGRAFTSAAQSLLGLFRNPTPDMRRLGLALLAIPACGIVLRLVLHFFARGIEVLWYEPYLRWIHAGLGLSRPPHLSGSVDMLAWCGAGLWLLYLWKTDRNPGLDLWHLSRYRPERLAGLPTPMRAFVNWGLHWWVLYWFVGTALWGFVKGNLGAMVSIGWADAGLQPDSISGVAYTVAYVCTHLPTVESAEAFFTMARYGLWTSCIFACVIGYGHTVLKVPLAWLGFGIGALAGRRDQVRPLLDKESIRHLDFTWIGWMANLICYDPWATATFKFIPHVNGPDPMFTADSPLFYLWLFTEFFLNLLYTLSILNMGTKFGVMVDKGMVKNGFFSVVRHPSYTLEALMFSVMFTVGASGNIAWAGLFAHPLLYWFRSERDEQFMTEANPDYTPYKQEVRWKFIRGLY